MEPLNVESRSRKAKALTSLALLFFPSKKTILLFKLKLLKPIQPDLVLILKHVGKQFSFLMPVKSAANCDAAFTDKSCKRRVKSWSSFSCAISFSVVAPPTTNTISPFVDDDRLQ